MPSHKVHFTQEELHAAFSANIDQAEKIVQGDDLNEFISQVKAWLHKTADVPVLGKITGEITTMIDLLQDYADGSYRDIPVKTIISMVAVLIYVISPVDLIPDIIPIVGYIDDVALVLAALQWGLHADLEKYKSWRDKINKTNYSELVDLMHVEFEHLCESRTVAAILMADGFDGLKFLFSDDDTPPLDCTVISVPVSKGILGTININREKDILSFYNSVIEQCNIAWSVLGKKSLTLEGLYSTFEDDFAIIDEDISDD